MSNPQQRLDELLRLSNEELDRLAAECQGWKVEIGYETTYEDFALPRPTHTAYSCYVGPDGVEVFKGGPYSYHPSTDLNQAWAIAKNANWLRPYRHGMLYKDDERFDVYHAKEDEHTPARILTAFGILARELEKQEV